MLQIDGKITELKIVRITNGKYLAFLKIERKEKLLNLIIFPEIFEKYKDLLGVGKSACFNVFEKEKILFVNGLL